MPDYRFLTRPDERQVEQIVALYRAAGWWSGPHDAPSIVPRLVSGSHAFLAAFEEGRIVAMGRAISDRTSDAYIQDVTVAASHRHRGIATEIVRRLAERLAADGIGWIGLIAERNTDNLYRRIGFAPMADSIPMLKTKT